MFKRYARTSALVVVLTLVAGCGAPQPIPSPPTTTTVPATATPLPPTATPDLVPAGGSNGLIAFYSERDGNAEIYTMRPDGGDQRRLTFNTCDDYSPVWSPDGSQIAFLSNREDPNPSGCFPECFYQLYVMNADGSDEHKLVNTAFAVHHPDWHPNGTRLSFDTERNLQGDVYVVDIDGNDPQLLIKDGFWADWSPDGTQVVFASNRDGNVEIYTADADGSNQRRLTENARLDFFPAWSPDGRHIAFATREQKQIVVVNADGSDERPLADQGRGEDPAWSPDGTQIAFQSSRDGDFEIYTLDVEAVLRGDEDVRPQRLTETGSGDFWPSWGPAFTLPSGSTVSFEKSAQILPSVPTWRIGLANLDGDDDLDIFLATFGVSEGPNEIWFNVTPSRLPAVANGNDHE